MPRVDENNNMTTLKIITILFRFAGNFPQGLSWLAGQRGSPQSGWGSLEPPTGSGVAKPANLKDHKEYGLSV